MKGFVLTLACACLALSACSDRNTVPTEPEAAVPLLATNTLTGDTENVPASQVDASVTYTFAIPSTNDANYAEEWAHVLFKDVGVGQVTLTFVSKNNWYSCFEYRIDDEAPTVSGANPNPHISDGRWSSTCRFNDSEDLTFNAVDHVDIRMVFGAERDERFDWTRFYVLSIENKDQCQAGDWEAAGFRNQGQCVRYVETGRDSRVGG